MEFDNVTFKQIHNMKHAIGVKHERIKRKRYSAFRNYFYTKDRNESWEDLILKKLAIRSISETGGHWYYVTRKGLDFLEELMLIKIIETD